MSKQLRSVIQGENRFCAPGVISAILQISTDEAAELVNELRGKRLTTAVTSVYGTETLTILKQNGWDYEHVPHPRGYSLFACLSIMNLPEGIYIVGLPRHVAAISVEIINGKKEIFFIDNHSKSPINAVATANTFDRVTSIHRIERDDFYSLSN